MSAIAPLATSVVAVPRRLEVRRDAMVVEGHALEDVLLAGYVLGPEHVAGEEDVFERVTFDHHRVATDLEAARNCDDRRGQWRYRGHVSGILEPAGRPREQRCLAKTRQGWK